MSTSIATTRRRSSPGLRRRGSRRRGIARGGYCLDLEVPASSWEEILGLVLRFGAEGEVLGPAIFREKWLAEIEAMAEVARRARGSDTTPQT
ncbi:MAG: WYL domain-containing protein [Rectinemataceae bacterium]